jgi:hypothetical protein
VRGGQIQQIITIRLTSNDLNDPRLSAKTAWTDNQISGNKYLPFKKIRPFYLNRAAPLGPPRAQATTSPLDISRRLPSSARPQCRQPPRNHRLHIPKHRLPPVPKPARRRLPLAAHGPPNPATTGADLGHTSHQPHQSPLPVLRQPTLNAERQCPSSTQLCIVSLIRSSLNPWCFLITFLLSLVNADSDASNFSPLFVNCDAGWSLMHTTVYII